MLNILRLLLAATAIARVAAQSAPRRSLVVHTGPWKTGSAHIQRILFLRRDELNAAGIFYPLAKGETLGNHNYVANIGKGMWDTDFERDIISRAATHHVIISSERLPFVDDRGLKRIRDTFGQHFDIKIVVFYRNAFEHAYATWQHSLRDLIVSVPKSWLSLDNRMAAVVKDGGDTYHRAISRYRYIFGSPAVTILDYDDIIRKKEDVFVEMCRATGLPLIPVTAKSSDAAEPRGDINRQMWVLLDRYTREAHSCSTTKSKNDWYRFHFGTSIVGQHRLPKRCETYATARIKAIELDKSFRREYRSIFIGGNAQATARQIMNFHELCQLDIEAVTDPKNADHSYYKNVFEEQYRNLPIGISCVK